MNKFFVGLLLAMLPLLVFGCITPKAGSPMNNYASGKIAIAPFDFEEGAEEIAKLTSDVGTRLKLKLKENEWIFDKSEALQPVADQLAKLGLSPKKIYVDPKVAVEVGKALGVDVIIVGHVSSPRMEHELDDAKYYDMSQPVGLARANIYTLLKQRANIDVSLKVVDVKSEAVVWQKDKLKGSIKYVKCFQAQSPRPLKKPKDEKVVKANMREHITLRVIHALYPDKFEDKRVPEILEVPPRKLKNVAGELVIF